MPIYVYETQPTTAGTSPERFEVRQAMSDAPLTTHPESGVPVHRVLSGGLVTFTSGAATGPSAPPSGGCGSTNCCRM